MTFAIAREILRVRGRMILFFKQSNLRASTKIRKKENLPF